jgi:4-hydroxyphenylpyruvate dioxygenase
MRRASNVIERGFALATTCIGVPLARSLEAGAAAGFSWIEFFWRNVAESGLSLREIRQISEDLGLKAQALQPIRGFEGEAAPGMGAGFRGAVQFMDAAAELGAALVGVCASETEAASGPDGAADMLARLAEMAKYYGLDIGYEALSWSPAIHDLAEAWEAVRRVDAANLGLVVDSFDIGARRNDPRVISAIPASRIAAVQVSSTHAPLDGSLIEVSRHHRCYPDEGHLEASEVVRQARLAGYKGPVTLELFNDDYRSGDPFAVAAAGYASLQRLCGHQRITAP